MNILIVDNVKNQTVIARASYNPHERSWEGRIVINEEERDDLTIQGRTEKDIINDFQEKLKSLISLSENKNKPFKGSFKRTKVEKPILNN